MSSPVALQPLGSGRAMVRYGGKLGPHQGEGLDELTDTVRGVIDTAFADPELRVLIWAVPQGDWTTRRIAWSLGFSLDGTVRRGLAVGGELADAWVGTLLRDEPREPRHPWLQAPVIEGDGVRLRPLTGQDVPRIVQGSADPITQHWLAQLPRPYTESDAHAYLEANTEREATNAGVTWAFVDPADDATMLGEMGLFHLVRGREVEVGYWAHPDARGRGLTARATALAIGYAFGELGVPRVAAHAAVGNEASRRVLERCGMREIGVSRLGTRLRVGSAADLVGYDVLVSDFAERSAKAATASTAKPASESATPTTSGDR